MASFVQNIQNGQSFNQFPGNIIAVFSGCWNIITDVVGAGGGALALKYHPIYHHPQIPYPAFNIVIMLIYHPWLSIFSSKKHKEHNIV